MSISQSLRCAQLCAFIRMPINGSIPVDDACEFITRSNSQCSVFVEINHEKREATGRLGMETCSETSIRRVDTIVKLDFSLLSIIRYTCKKNDCDIEFLNNLLERARNIPLVNRNLTEENIGDLIYNTTLGTSPTSCNSSAPPCSANEICEGQFDIEDISNDISINRYSKTMGLITLKRLK
ncbi:unnamed protein product [Rotaria sp. Silwood1]|nr:unnamed protein product [Rotaria sp. Silwood1]CAF1269762.1 unnamed protein product [Rotaria sp. Silwood1]CAF3502347.1 unnamed protein product [Rotaria sp. Silwood1]CAF3506849.1 unnamed protein product [Rotaria sp. Silwood1]CAF4559339.1 unnamed protein product [Rotaria sp. Silwood1]